MNPAIIIPCYNRTFSLERLLGSLSQAVYPSTPVPLIISIDGPLNAEVEEMAQNFVWKYGPKTVVVQQEHLGLKNHIFLCVDWVEEYENVIILEDDLMVSPYFYEYALKAVPFYHEEDKVGGISLYSYQVSEFSNHNFEPINDGFDVYFLQLPSSWGQIFNKSGWRRFKDWLKKNHNIAMQANIPSNVKDWGDHSWKKHFIHYMVSNDLYFVFPRVSLSTNFEELGTNSDSSGKYQVPIQNKPKEYVWSKLENSQSVYDAFFEIKPQSLNKWRPELSDYEYEVDLNCTKEHIHAEFVLSRGYSSDPVYAYSSELKPLLHNVIYLQDGNDIVLAQKDSFVKVISMDEPIRFFILLPICNYNEKDITDTINSFLSNHYSNKKLILLSPDKYSPNLKELIIRLYYKNRFQIQIQISEFYSQTEHLKNGLKNIKSGIVSWLEPGSLMTKEGLFYIAKAFQLEQVNSILATGRNKNIEDVRFTSQTLFHYLSSGYQLNPQHLFFRAGLWDKLRPYFESPCYKEDLFFQVLLIGLTRELDLRPLVDNIGSENEIKLLPLSRDLYDDTIRFVTKKEDMVCNGFLFKLFWWSFKKGIPILKRFYRHSYDLPLVVRIDGVGKTVFFSNK